MAKKQGTRNGDNGDIYIRRFDWGKVWIAVVTAVLASLLTGGTVLGLKLSTSQQLSGADVSSSTVAVVEQKLDSYMKYNDKNIKLQFESMQREIGAVRDDQRVMKQTLGEILSRLPRKQ